MTASTTQQGRSFIGLGAKLGLALGLCWGLGLAAHTAAASAAVANRVLGIDVAGAGSARRVRIRTERAPTFTVFRLADPMRVVVDISGGDISAVDGPVVVEDGVVGQIALRQFDANGFLIGRVLVGFESSELSYDVQAKGTAVVIQIQPPGHAVAPALPPPAAPVDEAEKGRLEASRQTSRQAAEQARAAREAAEQTIARARQEQARAEALAQQARGLHETAARAKEEASKLQAQTAATRQEATERVQHADARLQQAQQARAEAADKLSQAEASKAEAASLREQAEEALTRSRTEAAAAASQAEERVQQAEQRARQAEADRDAAEQGRKSAEEQQARLSDVHRRRVAELEAKVALLAKERGEAASARAVAAAEQNKAQALSAELKAARAAAAEADRAAAAKLATASARAREARAALERAAGARARVAEDRKRLSGELAALQTKQAQVADELAVLAKKRAQLVALTKQARAAKRQAARLAAGASRGPAKAAPVAPVEVAQLVEPVAQRRRPRVFASRGPVTRPGPRHRLVGVRRVDAGQRAKVLLVLDGDPQKIEYEIERVEDPPRLVVDLRDTARGTRRAAYPVRSPYVRRVRLGEHPNALRAVLDLSRDVPVVSPLVSQTAEGLLVAFASSSPPSPTPSPPPPQAGATAAVAPAEPSSAAKAGHPGELRDIRFEKAGAGATITLLVDRDVAARVDDRSGKAWVLKLTGARVAKKLERSLDVSAYGTPVRLVSSYQVSSEPPMVHVVASLSRAATFDLRRDGDRVEWEIRAAAKPPAVAVKSAAAPQTAGYAAEATALAKSIPAQRRGSKKRISIDLKDADIVNVIRLLSEVSGQNIITSDEVTGKVSLKLRNVPWDQALNTILKTKGYDKEREHNILRIAPAAQIQAGREAEAARRRAKEQVEQTMTKLLPINYAVADQIKAQVEPMLTGRGSVKDDPRTNTLIINDVESNIGRLVELARRLDRQTPQVLIEARIVEAQSNTLQELGIQWGGIGQATQRQGTQTGLSFPGDVTVSGAADDPIRNRTEGVLSPSLYAVNLPAPIGAGIGGGIGFTFGSVGGAQLLNLRLTAMEENGTGRIISSPRVTTLDNVTARITQGIDIPISVVSAAGTNTRFQSAALELEVTPHVTNDGSVMMEVKTSKNEPDFARVGGAGDPTILKKSAETQVMVRDGDTTVIGGIFTRTTSETYAEVPFLGKLPIVGWFFKKRRSEDKRAELLVFITPRIVNREQALGGMDGG